MDLNFTKANSRFPVIVLPSSANPSYFGQPVSFTATVVGTGTPTGLVQFTIGGVAFRPVTVLSNGSATSGIISNLSLGNHTIKATYSGDSIFSTCTGTITQTVN